MQPSPDYRHALNVPRPGRQHTQEIEFHIISYYCFAIFFFPRRVFTVRMLMTDIND